MPRGWIQTSDAHNDYRPESKLYELDAIKKQ